MKTIGCIDNTIGTASGNRIDLIDPKPEQIDIQSIAAGLSKICRYGGQCTYFYSVAEHSIHCARLAEAENQPLDVMKAVLLHDAAEAYLGDIVKPLKIALPDYAKIEARMEDVISERFNVDFKSHHDIIKKYDWQMLKKEKQTLYPKEQWSVDLANIEDVDLELLLEDDCNIISNMFVIWTDTLGIE